MAIQQYSVKPEQLQAVQDKVKKMLAEGYRLDGSKPVQSWRQLHEENHSLKKQMEEMADTLDDYKRRYEFERQGFEQLAEVFDRTSRENTALKTQLETARGVLQALAEFIRRENPGLLEMIFAEPVEEQVCKPRKAEHKTPEKRRSQQRRYYERHRESRKEYAKRYYEAHKEALAQEGRGVQEEEKCAKRLTWIWSLKTCASCSGIRRCAPR